jgi:hypothetical protein
MRATPPFAMVHAPEEVVNAKAPLIDDRVQGCDNWVSLCAWEPTLGSTHLSEQETQGE